MIRTLFLIAACCASLFAADARGAEESSAQGTPVLVELFTSEGCSSCPPADSLLIELHRTQPVDGARLYVLSEHVDYWNRLGWVDPFSDASFSKRQSWYSMRWPTRVYTPQAVVDGTYEFVGSDAKVMRKAIKAALREPKQPLRLRAGEVVDDRLRVAVDLPEPRGKGGFDVYLALVEDDLASDVVHGENQGRRLEHVGVVRHLDKLGSARKAASFDHVIELDPGWKRAKLRLVAFAQDRRDRRVVALGAIDLPN